MHPKLAWVPELQQTLSAAMGLVTLTIEDHVDPLKKLVVIRLPDRLQKGEYNPIQNLVRGFAKANDCVVERIRRRSGDLVLEILTKRRLGPVRDKNPLR